VSESPAQEASPETSLPAKRIVIAEDETLIRLDIIEILRGEGYDVVAEADNGQRAVELAEEHRPDLVIMDVKMPVMDGISAAEKIAKARIAPVVLLTAFSQKELVERAREAGAEAIPVDDAFRLHDTFGFPLELTKELASERGLQVDEEGFRAEMQLQR